MGLFETLLAERRVLLADGATGTNLFDMGLQSGEAPELWNDQHPDRIEALHQSFIEAGADIILTNSFGGSCHRLKLHNAQDRVRDLNEEAARIARAAVADADRPVLVAGSVGPTGELLVPLGGLTYEDAVEAFREQMQGLADGGVDLVWIETMSAEEEIAAALEAARTVGLPAVVTASFDTAGRTMMGVTPASMGRVAQGAVAYGANCGVGASDILASLLSMADASDDERPIVVKGNCGIPQFQGTEIVYSGTPEQMARYATLAVDGGARIVGGCCGTTAEHLRAMRHALDNHQAGTIPTLDQIEREVGAFTNALPNASNEPSAARRGRRARTRA